MKKLIFLLLCVSTACCMETANAQKSKESQRPILTETFDLKGFDGISSSSGIDVFIETGSTYKVMVETNLKSTDNLKIHVSDGMLHLGYRRLARLGGVNIKTKVYVTMPKVRQLEASSGSDIKAKGLLRGDILKISASSAADIVAAIDYHTVIISCSSGADVKLTGEANDCSATCSSGADIDLSGLECIFVKANASSGADIKVYATESIEASASSGADIYYWGDPRNVDVNHSSGGSVKRKN